MSSKKRRRRRGGRPRQDGIREPNGRLSRKTEHVKEREAMTEAEAKSVVLEARKRHTGLPDAFLDLTDAGRPNAGTTHGRLHLQGFITRDQFQAAEWYIGTRLAYLRSIKAPELPTIGGIGNEHDESAYAKWCEDMRETWTSVINCLQEASIQSRSPIIAAFDVILMREQILDHMVGDLRLGLNAIHRVFLAGQRKAA